MRNSEKKIATFLLAGMVGLGGVACQGPNDSEKDKIVLSDVVNFIVSVPEGRAVRILQLTDTQIIDAGQKRTEDRLSASQTARWDIKNIEDLAYKYMDAAVAATQPDLIVLTGDNTYGEFDDNGTVLQAFIAKMDSYEIPWTAVYGNHDPETMLGAKWMNEQYENSQFGMFTRGPDEAEGNGNFTIGITQGGVLTEVLFLLDTHGCAGTDPDTQRVPHSDPTQKLNSLAGIFVGQKAWYSSVCERLREYNGGKNVKSLAFFHYGLSAFGEGLKEYGYTGSNLVEIGEKNANGDWGAVRETCAFVDTNFSFFNMLKENGTEGAFFGHNHKNAASVVYQGVRLTYGVKSSVYDSHDTSMLGGTLIEVTANSLDVTPWYYKK